MRDIWVMIDKGIILKTCLDLVGSKIEITKKEMEAAQASANEETKSSAGDKYETGRAMSQNERDMHARQLAELMQTQKQLTAINPDHKSDKVELGAVVKSANGWFFIAASLGAITSNDMKLMAISAISPIAQAMLDKTAGDSFEWMNKSITIDKIYWCLSSRIFATSFSSNPLALNKIK